MKFTVNAFQEKMDTLIMNRKDNRKETMSCQEMMEACLEYEKPASWNIKDTRRKTATCQDAMEANAEETEPNPGMMQSVEELQGIPKGEAAVMPVGRRGSSVGSGIRPWSATRSQRKGPGDIVGHGKE
jgi:hypothetical protein